jgi:cysteinyl-tRNA synthetase
VAFDIIRRYLEYTYGESNVTFVTNYTDIDDKMINRANKENITVPELADRIIPEYETDYASLGIKPATIQTKATDYIPQMIEIIEKLIEKGHAYETKDGVYFEIETFKEYGKLSNQKLAELRAGARVEADKNKRHPYDFALWKTEKPGEPSWESPWGKGRPGWHIECSAMSRAELGQPFDIHGGGADLTFPHHECEIAQSEAAHGVQFCNVWLHNGFITVDQEKMSKSLDNFFTLKDIFKKYDPRAVRYLFLTAHYRSPIEFSDTQLEQAQNTLNRLRDFINKLTNNQATPESPHHELDTTLNTLVADFEAALNNDFDTSSALAALFTAVKHFNKELAENILSTDETTRILETLRKLDTVFNILPEPQKELTPELKALIQERENARTNKSWARSDELRDELKEKGILIEDTPDGTTWKQI